MYHLKPKFLSILQRAENFWDRLEHAQIDANLSEVAKLLSKKGEEEATKAKGLIKDRLASAPKEKWTDAISSGKEPYALATEYLADGELRLGQRSALYTALEAAVPETISTADRGVRQRWFELSRGLKPKAEKELLGLLGSAIRAEKDASNALALLKQGDSRLLKYGGFSEHADVSVTLLVMQLMKTKKGRAWLKGASQEIREWVKRSKPETRRALAKALTAFEDGKIEERKYWAEAVRGNWELKPSRDA